MRKVGLISLLVVVVVLGLFGLTRTNPPGDTLPANMKPANAIDPVPTDAEGNICVSVSRYFPETDETVLLGSLKTNGIDFRTASGQERFAMALALRNAIVARHNASLTSADAGLCLDAGEAYADPPQCTDCSGGGQQCCGKWCPGVWGGPNGWPRCIAFCGISECYAVTECCGSSCNAWCNTPCCP